MRWDDFRRSDNIEDRRGDGSGGGMLPGGGGLPIRGGHIGIGGLLVLLVLGWILGINPLALLGGADFDDGGQTYQAPSGSTGTPQDQMAQFVAAVLGDTEDRWTEIFRANGRNYIPPKLVLFSSVTRSACGTAQSAMGPFYCPNDQRVYLDTAFFKMMQTQLHGCQVGSKACEFSQAYVIAHEVGHHVQNLLGTLDKAHRLQNSSGETAGNRVQVRVELQADCFAGVWANHSEAKWKFLEPGDVEAALQTASAIGDDILQKRAQGYAVPDSFTHGTAAQRTHWFTVGLKNGTVESCDTFSPSQP
ncbi:MAG TPA: neutral zinc metallopeptidase [Stellaceae bacterium]|nr:neutral zinc metallopeptidase [Stellaceae bacterium]